MRKIISIFTLIAFIIFSLSCSITSMRKVSTAADWHGKEGKIFDVVKTSGEHIEFSIANPGRIFVDKIIGTAIVLSKEAVIDLTSIKSTKIDKKGNIYSITSKDGKIHNVITGTAKEDEDKITFLTTYETSESVSIPLSEVESLRIKSKGFSFFTISTEKVESPGDWYEKKGKILTVVKISGEHIKFSRVNPGQISGDKITGTAIVLSKETIMDQANIKSTKVDQEGNIYSITSKDGKIHNVITGTAKEDEDKITFLTTYETSESVSIPLSEVSSLKIKQKNRRVTTLVIVGSVLVVVAAGFGIALAIAFAEH